MLSFRDCAAPEGPGGRGRVAMKYHQSSGITLEFPPDVYPPHSALGHRWQEGYRQKELTEAIAQATGKADVVLVLGKAYREIQTSLRS